MKQIAKFLIGSRVFFEGLDGFSPKDYDWLYIMDSFGRIKTGQLCMRKDGNDKILVPKLTKDEYIELALGDDFGIRAGKFFVPEFAEYIGFTINDLKKLEPHLDKLDDKHKYYKIIYDAYIENGDFILTEEQREAAYEEYKKERGM